MVTSCYDGQVRLYAPPLDGPDATPPESVRGRIKSALSGGGQGLKPTHRVRPPGGKRPFTVAFSPDSTRIAVGYEDSTAVDLLDGRTLAQLGSADTAGIGNGSLSGVAWSADGGTLFAGGRYANGGNFLALRWSKAGLGARGRPLRTATDTVMTLHAVPDGGLVIGASDGIFVLAPASPGAEPAPRWSSSLAAADFRYQLHDKGIRLSTTGDRVAFGCEQWGERPALFDLGTRALTLDPPAEALADLALPDEGGADPDQAHPDGPRCLVTDWDNNTEPRLAGRPLKLKPYETAFSLALSPPGFADGPGFCLGTHFRLRAYTSTGCERWQQPVPGVVWALNVTRDGRYAVAGYGDGTLRWHRLTDGAEVLALYPAPSQSGDPPGTQPRWVLWTPLGHYAASAGGEDLIGWHVNRGPDQAPDFFGASRLRERFNRPDVIALVLETGDPAAALRLADAARGTAPAAETGSRGITFLLPPVLRLLSHALTVVADGTRVDCTYKADSDAAPVLRVEARLDGRPLPLLLDRRELETDGGRRVVGQLRCLAPPGAGVLSLVPFSERGAGEAVLLPIPWSGDADWRKPRLYGLTVGVGAYPPQVAQPLRFPAADADAVAAELRAQAGGLYREVQVRPLTDAAAGRTAILEGLHAGTGGRATRRGGGLPRRSRAQGPLRRLLLSERRRRPGRAAPQRHQGGRYRRIPAAHPGQGGADAGHLLLGRPARRYQGRARLAAGPGPLRQRAGGRGYRGGGLLLLERHPALARGRGLGPWRLHLRAAGGDPRRPGRFQPARVRDPGGTGVLSGRPGQGPDRRAPAPDGDQAQGRDRLPDVSGWPPVGLGARHPARQTAVMSRPFRAGPKKQR